MGVGGVRDVTPRHATLAPSSCMSYGYFASDPLLTELKEVSRQLLRSGNHLIFIGPLLLPDLNDLQQGGRQAARVRLHRVRARAGHAL